MTRGLGRWLCVTCTTSHYYDPVNDPEGPTRHLALVRVWSPSCPVCGMQFHPRSRKRQYCSDACRYAARNERNKTNGYQQQYRARKRREQEEVNTMPKKQKKAKKAKKGGY